MQRSCNLRRLKAETEISNDRIYMNFSMQMTLPFLLTLLQISSTAWISCPLLTGLLKLWIQRRLKFCRLLSLTICLLYLSFSVNGDILSNVQEFTYLGNILSESSSLDNEVEHRIKAASADWLNVSSSITTLLYPLKWPFTGQSVSQLA